MIEGATDEIGEIIRITAQDLSAGVVLSSVKLLAARVLEFTRHPYFIYDRRQSAAVGEQRSNAL